MKKLLIMVICGCFFGCASTSGKFDPSQAMQAACAITPAAKSIHNVVCALLKGEAKEKCLAHQKKANIAIDALISIGAGVLGACQIGK